ncbi:MAG: hypothetical protein N2319_11155 [Candidatus Kapabacteria bacterium]|nr:hypothetical protein [Candidatus Kapabacteria bacterium]
MKRTLLLSILMVVFIILTSVAQIPQSISWQGILQDAQGNNLNGVHTVHFSFYDVANGGTPLWQEVQSVAINNGLASVILGDSFPINLPFNKQYWIEIKVGENTLPRIKLTSVPYAISAQNSNSLGNVIQNDSLVLKDANGVNRIIINPNTSTFKMMNNDTVWYSISVNSPPSTTFLNKDGSKVVFSGGGKEVKVYYPNGNIFEESYSDIKDNVENFVRTTYDKDGNKVMNESYVYNMKDYIRKGTIEKYQNGKLQSREEEVIEPEPTSIPSAFINFFVSKRTKKIFNENGEVIREINEGEDQKDFIRTEELKISNPEQKFLQYYKTNEKTGVKWSNDYSINQRTTTDQKGWIYELITPHQNNPYLIFSNDGKGSKAFLGAESIFLGSMQLSCYKDFEVGNNLTVKKDIKAEGVKNFRIEHPIDKSKYIQHASIESNEVLNVYSGNVTTNNLGLATVHLPDYFSLINIDYRYQLTVIGEFAQAIIFKEIENNSFVIKTDKPNIKVSWQVSAKRNDEYIQNNNFHDLIDK